MSAMRTRPTRASPAALFYLLPSQQVTAKAAPLRTERVVSGVPFQQVREFVPDEAILNASVWHLKSMFRISDTIRQTQTVDGGILLDVHHGQMFCLNIVGAKILELMQRGYDEPRIADEISRDYGASREVVRADVIEFIEVLHKNHILQPARASGVL
jgi:hypothetical protein